jgi:hypothetical protein
MMVDRMQKSGLNIEKKDDFPEGDDPGPGGGPPGGAPKPPAPGGGGGGGGAAQSEAERQAQIAANRARMAAMQAKK